MSRIHTRTPFRAGKPYRSRASTRPLCGHHSFPGHTGRFWWCLALLVLASACGIQARAGTPAWPEIEVPDSTHLQWVAPHTLINGVPQRIAEITTRLSDQALLDWFGRSWLTHKAKVRPVLTRIEGQTIIGLLQAPFLFTLQLSEGNRQRNGFLSIANLDSEARVSPPDAREFLLPASAELQFIQQDDHGEKSTRTLHFSSPASASWMRRTLPVTARDRAWDVSILGEVDSDGTTLEGDCLIITRNNVRRFIVISASADRKGSDVIIVEETLH